MHLHQFSLVGWLMEYTPTMLGMHVCAETPPPKHDAPLLHDMILVHSHINRKTSS